MLVQVDSDGAIQVTRAAIERNEDKRNQYQIFIAENFRPDQLVFVDESACNRITTKRPKAWSPTGVRARRRDYFIRGQRYVDNFQTEACPDDGLYFQIFYSSSYLAGWCSTSRYPRSFIYRYNFQ